MHFTLLYMSLGVLWHEPLQIKLALENPQDFPNGEITNLA